MVYLVDVVQGAVVYGLCLRVLDIQIGRYGVQAAMATERVAVVGVIILRAQVAAHILVKVRLLMQDVHIEYAQVAYTDV
jgi:hypothetical protein